MVVDDSAGPVGGAPQQENVHLGDRRQRALARATLACATLLAALSSWGWVVVLRGGAWAGWASRGIDEVQFAVALFVPAVAALLGAAAWLVDERRGGGEAAGWGRGAVLVAFVFPTLWRGPAVLWGQQWWGGPSTAWPPG